MKKIIALLCLIISIQQLSAQPADKVLWYRQPAKVFEESLVLGNGTQGASVFGGITTEKIYLNDATLWSGEPVNNKAYEGIYKNLTAVREALGKEDYPGAQELVKKLQGKYSQSYMALGTLYLEFLLLLINRKAYNLKEPILSHILIKYSLFI